MVVIFSGAKIASGKVCQDLKINKVEISMCLTGGGRQCTNVEPFNPNAWTLNQNPLHTDMSVLENLYDPCRRRVQK